MSLKDDLIPRTKNLVMDLVAAAQVDVAPWAESRNGLVAKPASNPKYCYEWAFTQPKKLIVVCLWHDQLIESGGQVSCSLNLRHWAEQVQQSRLKPSQRSAGSRRARRMDEALKEASEYHLPVRVIVGEGPKQDIANPDSLATSRMIKRLLDPEPWAVMQYDSDTGRCELCRSRRYTYVDQFDLSTNEQLRQYEVLGKVWQRDPDVRKEVLRRAEGKCEMCRQPGFQMHSGEVYLETHHVIPLCEQGADHTLNVVALCPNDHREAHHGASRTKIQKRLQAHLALLSS